MSRFLLNWFRAVAGLSDEARQFQSELSRLEEEAERADWRGRAQLFNRAGDLCAQAPDERDLALAYYGRSIDAHLEAGNFSAAAAMCRKLLRFAPRAVRAHCTLAFLCVRDPRLGDAESEILAYVTATKATRTERFAIPRLRMMAEVVDGRPLRLAIARSLLQLRDEPGAQHIFDAVDAGEHPSAALTEDARWDRLLRAAVMDPQELWERAWINFNTFQGDLKPFADLHEGRAAPREEPFPAASAR